MKYLPLDAIDRSHIGEHWTRKQLRAIQCILHVTHGKGKVSPSKSFAETAFGASINEFLRLLWMPETYIMYRSKFKDNGSEEWRSQYEALSKQDIKILHDIIKNDMIDYSIVRTKASNKIKTILNILLGC